MKTKPLTLDADELEALNTLENEPFLDVARPKTRADCANVPRPCPFVGCRHNLYLEVRNQSIIIYHPDKAPWELDPKKSCVLDVVENGQSLTLEQIGKILNVTRERVRQMVDEDVENVRYKILGMHELNGDDRGDFDCWSENSVAGGEDLDEPSFDLGSRPLPF